MKRSAADPPSGECTARGTNGVDRSATMFNYVADFLEDLGSDLIVQPIEAPSVIKGYKDCFGDNVNVHNSSFMRVYR